MYLPKHFEETDPSVLHALIRSHPLGVWVTDAADGLVANHIPWLLHADAGAHGTLVGHVARANPVWRSFSRTRRSLVVFQGPEAYITPSWYASKAETGKVVPTWNYAVVHAHGLPETFEDHDQMLAHVTELTLRHESSEARPWQVGDAPADFIDAFLKAIVGVRIPIERLEGKWKLGQNRTDADRQGAIRGLAGRDGEEARAVAALMAERLGRPARPPA